MRSTRNFSSTFSSDFRLNYLGANISSIADCIALRISVCHEAKSPTQSFKSGSSSSLASDTVSRTNRKKPGIYTSTKRYLTRTT